MALTFTLGQPCAGGNHFDVTMALGGRSITVPIEYGQLRGKMTREEVEEFAIMFLRFLISTHPNASRATIKNKLANASITVSL